MATNSATVETAHSTSSKPSGCQKPIQRVTVAMRVRLATLKRTDAAMCERSSIFGQLLTIDLPGTNNAKATPTTARNAPRSFVATETAIAAATEILITSIRS